VALGEVTFPFDSSGANVTNACRSIASGQTERKDVRL
jgi:hypothetical protein